MYYVLYKINKKNIYCISIYLIKDLYNKKHTTYSIVAFSGLLSGNLTADQHFPTQRRPSKAPMAPSAPAVD